MAVFTARPRVRYCRALQYARLDDLVARCDVITINCPLHAGTEGMFDAQRIAAMRPGSFLVRPAQLSLSRTWRRGVAGLPWYGQASWCAGLGGADGA